MAENQVNFRFGSTIEGKTVADNDLVAVNKNMSGTAEEVDSKFGSTYKGSKIIGTTEADKLCITEDFQVTGVTVGNLTSGVDIHRGDDIMTLLKKMLQKTIDVKASAPTAVLTPTGNTDVEYGTVPNDLAFTVTMTQGKFVAAESGWNTNQAMNCKLTDVKIDGNAAAIAENGMSATYTVAGTAIKAVKTVSATATVSANTVVPKKNDGENSTVTYNGGTFTVTGTKTWTPKFYYYVGYAAKTTVASLTSADVKALNAKTDKIPITGGNQTLVSDPITSDGKSIIIAVPSVYKLATVQNGVGASILGSFSETGQMTVECADGATYSYNVYIYPITNGAQVEFKNVTLVKA